MKEIKAKDIKQNMFSMLHDNWGIVCAGDENSSSGMTVSWGATGIMWEKPTVTVYIRPQRHTKVLIDANDRFSLSFLPEDMRHISQYFGKVSASDGTDKFKGAGAKRAFEDGVPYVDGADMVFICRKLISGEFDPGRIYDMTNDSTYYADRDYHTYYIAEIEKVMVK
ncbi:MAG: flavin reductase family protein [Anaerovoracaceae bacterium]|nr:flavin reductase family protein [Anaerovoracaceae bacterium]